MEQNGAELKRLVRRVNAIIGFRWRRLGEIERWWLMRSRCRVWNNFRLRDSWKFFSFLPKRPLLDWYESLRAIVFDREVSFGERRRLRGLSGILACLLFFVAVYGSQPPSQRIFTIVKWTKSADRAPWFTHKPTAAALIHNTICFFYNLHTVYSFARFILFHIIDFFISFNWIVAAP